MFFLLRKKIGRNKIELSRFNFDFVFILAVISLPLVNSYAILIHPNVRILKGLCLYSWSLRDLRDPQSNGKEIAPQGYLVKAEISRPGWSVFPNRYKRGTEFRTILSCNVF